MQKTSKRVLALVLSIVMVLSVFSISVGAYNADYQSETHTVFKHTEQTLAPGVEQYTNYAYTKADGKQMVYYVTTADVTRDDVMLQVSYKGMQHDTFGMEKLTQTVATANEKYSDPASDEFISEYYSVVSATNGNGYNMTTGQPSGVWAMGGEIIQEYTGSTAFFAILKDGRAVMGKTVAEWNAYKADPGIEEAINAFGSILVWDGAPAVSATGSYYTDRASRTMLGITEDGKVILIVVDGRQEPFSCGASMAELAQIMMEAGAQYAINLDGGGSTTYMAKNEGTNDCVIVNRPSDGSERAISNGLIVASLAAPSDVFDHAVLSVDNDYVMPGASIDVTATGVSPAGTSAEIPAEVSYTAEIGSVVDGVYTAGNEAGFDTISMIYDGNVVGTCEVNVVIPDSIVFTGASIACPYGKTTDLGVVPMYGVHEVAFSTHNVTFTLGDSSFGTIDNEAMTFTATSDPVSSAKTTLTVVTNCDPSVSATVDLQVGKGSEVIWDFEDQSTENMSLFDYYNSGVRGSLDIVNSETGKVKNGDYALAINYDFSQLTYYEDYIDLMFCYNAEKMKEHGNTKDADGVVMGGAPEDFIYITGATGIGMWIYIPDEVDAKGLNPRFFFGFKKNATDAWTRGTSGMKLLVDVQHLPTDNWYYYYADLSAYSSYAALTLQASRSLASNGTSKNGQKGYPTDYYAGPCFEFYVEDSAWKSYKNKSYNSKFTLFIDDYTVDYSSVVEDREAPEFGNATYATNGMSDSAAFTDGITLSRNTDIDFSINVADATRKLAGGVTTYTPTNNATGIKASSAKAYIDGNEIPCTYKNGRIALDKAMILADGPHTMKFTIEDNNGNMGYKNLTFNVAADSGYDTIVVKPHDETLTETPVGSLYYIDLVATDISKIKSASATLKVNNVNDWEPEGAVTADGFKLEYATEPGDAGELTVTITKTGNVSESGEAVLASIPIRTWYPHNDLGKNSNWIITQKKCVYPMDIQMVTKAGSIEYVNDTDVIGAFSADKIQIDSEAMCEYGYIGVQKGNEGGTTTVTSWHEHNAQPMADKPATCTEDGYTGRTFCEGCNSVIEWGMTVPATNHTYELAKKQYKFIISDNGASQSADLDFNGGIGYYVDNGSYVSFATDSTTNTITFTKPSSFNNTPTLYYWNNFETPVQWPGVEMTYAGKNDFGEDQYTFEMPENPELLMCTNCGELFTGDYTDGKYYVDGVPAQGWIDNKYYTDGECATGIVAVEGKYYEFADDGTSLGLYTGLVQEDGVYHYAKLGVLTGGWVEIDEEWYYFDAETLAPVAEKTFTYPNSKAVTTYQFEENGKIVDGVWVKLAEGTRYYYGPDFYKLNSKTGNVYFVDIHGSTYGFDGNGFRHEGIKFVKLSSNPQSLAEFTDEGVYVGPYTGIYEGKYYVDGYINAAGLIKVDSDYFYITQQGKVYTSGKLYLSDALTNGLVPAGKYEFDADGRMVVKNGVIDGSYYENGIVVPSKGLVLVDGAYYYVKQTGQVYVGNGLYVSETKANGLKPAGSYDFGADGKMIVKEGIIDGYYYENGSLVPGKGLVKIDGSLYFVKQTGAIYKNSSLYVSEAKANGFKPAGYYDFDADGKMIVKEGIIDGYYYENGSLVAGKGLVEIDGSFYFIKQTGAIYTGSSLYVSEAKSNGLVAAGYYRFNSDGTMIVA